MPVFRIITITSDNQEYNDGDTNYHEGNRHRFFIEGGKTGFCGHGALNYKTHR